MANLARTNAEWLRFLREQFLFVRMARETIENRDRYRRERIQVKNINDATSSTPHFTSVVLTGVVFGTNVNPAGNTAHAGILYVRFVANGGNWDVHLYKATGGGGGDEVGTVTNVAASATGTIVAANSSGLAGTVTLGANIAGETNDRHQLFVYQDWKREFGALWPSDGTTDDDAYSREAATRMCSDLAALEQQKLDRIITGYSEWALGNEQNPVGRGAAFVKQAVTSLISEAVDTDEDGAVTRSRTGFLEVLRDAMEDEATGSEQDIVKRVVAAGAGSFDGANVGLGAVASHTPEHHCPIGTWRFECVKGVDTDDLGAETFDGVFTEDNTDRTISLRGLVVGQSWKGPEGFGPVTLTRTLTKTGDGSNLRFTAASAAVVTGENNRNTDGGVLYWAITANGSNWDIAFYRSGSYGTSYKVAEATNIATSAAFTATAKNASGLTIAWQLGGTPSAVTGTLLLNPFYVQNTSNVRDKFSIATTLTSSGTAQRVIQKMFNYFLNDDTSGSELIPDSLAAVCNVSFGPYLVEDN